MSTQRSQRARRARVPLIVKAKTPSSRLRLTGNQLISSYHFLIKQREQLTASSSSSNDNSEQLSAIDERIAELGGLQHYQQISIAGHERSQHRFNSSRWVMDRLRSIDLWADMLRSVSTASSLQRRSSSQSRKRRREAEAGHETAVRRLRLLDIGATGPHYLPYAEAIDCTAIDLQPQHPDVRQQDFFSLPFSSLRASFDAVVLSLVLNFVPSPPQRGLMLLRACELLTAEGGRLFIVLPSACLLNSRWMDEQSMRRVLQLCGLTVEELRYSAKLVMLQAVTAAGGQRQRQQTAEAGWQPRLVRHAQSCNNFSLSLPAATQPA